MSRLLLDTHSFLWWLAGDESLSTRARAAIGENANAIFVSAASSWEITTKHRLGKLPGANAIAWDLAGAIESQGFVGLPITIRHGQAAGALPGPHQDPFDLRISCWSPTSVRSTPMACRVCGEAGPTPETSCVGKQPAQGWAHGIIPIYSVIMIHLPPIIALPKMPWRRISSRSNHARSGASHRSLSDRHSVRHAEGFRGAEKLLNVSCGAILCVAERSLWRSFVKILMKPKDLSVY